MTPTSIHGHRLSHIPRKYAAPRSAASKPQAPAEVAKAGARKDYPRFLHGSQCTGAKIGFPVLLQEQVQDLEQKVWPLPLGVRDDRMPLIVFLLKPLLKQLPHTRLLPMWIILRKMESLQSDLLLPMAYLVEIPWIGRIGV